ncbi:glycine oxidase ThiO [Peteryoungia desertarenae]|uniref:Glycine oxidase ThiO n=1 Tax=Peteryoungia desertarenae TaxID=1813451 RepID=A0ABX6QJS3_9HYPH|nr:glycine oxidase ThiO [Peteryoungia desertarenae]QLF68808.1 glycine oxidase ThiO [Peteryoungia desertarenae]
MTVLVKGAGVAGLATALELARRGISVEVVEHRTDIGLGASHWAGGMLAPYCEREAAEEIVMTLGLSAANWWDEAAPGLVQRRGTLVLANPRDLSDLKRFASRTRGHRWLGEDAIAELEPDLKGRFGTGLFFSEEAHLDPRQALRGLYQAARQLGVSFRFGEKANDAGAYASVVDCRGPQAIGEIEDMRGVRGEMLYLETTEVSLSRPVRLLHPRHPLYIVPRGNGLFMLGATMIEAEDDGPITARSMMELLNTAYALHPAFAEARIVETGTGIRPAFPDNVPRLIETSEGLAVAGMHRHGFLLAPAMAREAAERLTTTHASERRRSA